MSKYDLSMAQLIADRNDLVRIIDQQMMLLQEMKDVGLVPEHEPGKNLVIDSKRLPESLQILAGEKHKLAHFDVVLAVVGTMKAGKSTAINAMVGREILPNRNRPMTALPTLICHEKGVKEPLLTFENEAIQAYVSSLRTALQRQAAWQGKSELEANPDLSQLMSFIADGGTFAQEYQGSEEIYQCLSRLNDLVRLSQILAVDLGEELSFPYESCRNIDSLPKIKIEFAPLKGLEDIPGRLMLLDTPGPNEAKQQHLKTMLAEQLNRSSAVLAVLDYTQLKSEADDAVRAQLQTISKINKSRLYALVNKFDAKNANSDDAELTREMVFKDLLEGQIEKEHIYPISAQNAYLASSMLQYIAQHNDVPEYQTQSWVADFAQKALGVTDAEEWAEEGVQKIQRRAEKLLGESLMAEPIENVIMAMQKTAPIIAIEAALCDVLDVFNNVHNVFDIKGYFAQKVSLTDAEMKRIEDTIIRLREDINGLQTLKNEVEVKLDALVKDSNASMQLKIQDLMSLADSGVVNLFQKYVAFQENEEKRVSADYQKAGSFLVGFSEGGGQRKKARQELARALEAALYVIENAKGDKIIFSEQAALDDYLWKMNKVVAQICADINDSAQELVREGEAVIQANILAVENDCQAALAEIKKSFGNEGFDLLWSIPTMEKFYAARVDSINILMSPTVKTINKTRDQSGWWGNTKRWFGDKIGTDWGRDQVTLTTYELSAQALLEKIKTVLRQEVFVPLEQQMAGVFSRYSKDCVSGYIEYIHNMADGLATELEMARRNEEQPYAEKQEYKAQLQRLAQKNKLMAAEINSLKSVFGPQTHDEVDV